jgi:hypothetical protein
VTVRLLKNARLLRFSCLPAGRLILPRVKHGAGLLRRMFAKYASIDISSLLRISGALHPGIFEQPAGNEFFSASNYCLEILPLFPKL